MYVCMYVCDLPITSPIPYDCHVDDELEAIENSTHPQVVTPYPLQDLCFKRQALSAMEAFKHMIDRS